jgi:hypothetical protein
VHYSQHLPRDGCYSLLVQPTTREKPDFSKHRNIVESLLDLRTLPAQPRLALDAELRVAEFELAREAALHAENWIDRHLG